ncbi:MAG: hypothetical protein JXA13_10160 [Anaerolineales bacterium]|nr:hypothetical protein [Anaerolineales bacterium]
MKKKINFRKIVGGLLCTAAAAGMIFGLIGLIQIWNVRPRVLSTLDEMLASLDLTLEAAEEGLTLLDQMLVTTSENIIYLKAGVDALAEGIHDSGPMLEALTILTSEDLPESIAATQTSLASAQKSARLIDDTLSALSKIPLLPIKAYQPETPLSTSLKEVSASLDPLPESLAAIETSTKDIQENLETVEKELTRLSDSIAKIEKDLTNAGEIIDQYQASTSLLTVRVEKARETAARWVNSITWGLTFLLVWFLIAQVGLLVQGLEMWEQACKQKK